MITEDYVSFKIAKLLKEKGFNERSLFRYDDCGQLFLMGGYYKTLKGYFTAPTIQMALKWLRRKHHKYIIIQFGNIGDEEPKMQWWWELFDDRGRFCEGSILHGNKSYEQACEKAIMYCLKNLI